MPSIYTPDKENCRKRGTRMSRIFILYAPKRTAPLCSKPDGILAHTWVLEAGTHGIMIEKIGKEDEIESQSEVICAIYRVE